ncbi:MAG: dTDP-4-dehydrorhamnose reductase [Rhodospirillaceae bacterium]|nr:dTDP-4-dehydrorhamnose reductase [Rhodospirillaceae bacterium]MBT7484751.1 dTDP-4-dehydrorhamnose reductase [Rhodospirillales bacterium]MBT4702328.1 dTDP-4-dehydrorhamnose reductase [Rhodospirillaceae bacterium]MBT5034460.1 dTDP-4-dehydrorhamnose reductase [Rhodospirillaceae bacterium]MBT6220118.1 dTDP-4-dehydrorhamnose reductase [Rhodospirillaceae bacterium]
MQGGSFLICGAEGQVGAALAQISPPRGVRFFQLSHDEFDISDAEKIAETFSSVSPNLVINAAAFTDVDGAEDDPDAAYLANKDGPARLADACTKAEIPLLHVSTDFVFDGTKPTPYTESDPVSPLSVYGKSKAEGERAVRESQARHIILRTAWVFGKKGSPFINAIIKKARQGNDLLVVDDQIGGPTSADDIARALITMANSAISGTAPWGTYHFSGEPDVSRYELAKEIVAHLFPDGNNRPNVERITSKDYPTKAKRPANVQLDCSKILREFSIERPNWSHSLKRVVADFESEKV